MFTVVVAEKEHILGIQEYKTFLKPFLDSENVAFCEWHPNGQTLEEAVPHLPEAVSRRSEWRLITVCDESGLQKSNPFDLAAYTAPARGPDESAEAYLEKVRAEKFCAFDQAAQFPLTRLMTWLCAEPMAAAGKNNAAADPEFAEYLAEAQRKSQLRAEIVGTGKPTFSLPSVVLCIAKRTCLKTEYDIHASWTPHVDHQYSRFYDWNLYFDKMRYLVFDILPKTHLNYTFDYIRFLYLLMLLASHKVPDDCLKPNRIYGIACENDETAMCRMLALYDAKLVNTDELLERRIEALQSKKQRSLSDEEARSIFCSNVTVPVLLPREFDKSALFAAHKRLGLSNDCPEDEYSVWDTQYRTSREALHKLLKQPRRAIKKAGFAMHAMNRTESEEVRVLNEFQLDDISEHIEEEEQLMVSTLTADVYDTKRFHKQMDEADQKIKGKIETRMTKKATLFLGISSIVLYLVGFLPLLFSNASTAESNRYALLMMCGGVLLLALCGVICLFCLRRALKRIISDFNETMGGIDSEIEGSMLQYSKYLSHVCNMMRGFSVLNYRKEHPAPDSEQAAIYKKHRRDILKTRNDLREVFGQFLNVNMEVDPIQAEAYPFDYSRPVDFTYTFPYSEALQCEIEFMQTGSTINAPVDFVKRISVRMEELYD